jgi:PST family polysaccharide transporter
MAVVARIVSPEELGIFALAVTVHAVLVTMAELGVASAIARSDLDVDKIAPTMVTISVVAAILAVPMAVFSDQIAQFVGNEDAGNALRILSIGVALIGPLAVPGALLQREFRQKIHFWASAAAFIPASATLIVLSVLGDGTEAFAWSRIVGQLVTAGVILACSSRLYIPALNKSLLRPLLAFGLPLSAANLLSQVLLNADYVFIGQLLPAADLGIYFLAFGIAMWPTSVIGSMLNSVVLPGVSGVLRDGGDVAAAVAQGARTISLVVFPLGAFLFTFADQLILTVYGPAWVSAGPVLSILAAYGVLFVFGLFMANILIAMGKTVILVGVQVAALAALIPALWMGITLGGLEGAAFAHIVVIGAVTSPIYLLALRRSTSLRLSVLFKAIRAPALSAGITAIAAWIITLPFRGTGLSILCGGVVGLVVYTMLNRQALANLLPGAAGDLLRGPAFRATSWLAFWRKRL